MVAKKSQNIWQTAALILIGVLIGYMAGRFEFMVFPQDVTEKTKVIADENVVTTPDPPEIQIIDEDGDPSIGSNNASIVIVDFSDYQCPFCDKFYTTILPSLKKDYIDTGKIKYVYRDFPLNIHPKAMNAAMAAECANDQNKYWEMHDMIFDNQAEWGVSEDVNAILISYATELGLNTSTFTSCLNDEKYKEEIEKDRADAIKYGAKGTPTLFVNGKILRGVPQSYETFKNFIEGEL